VIPKPHDLGFCFFPLRGFAPALTDLLCSGIFSANPVIEGLLSLSPSESSRLLIESAREELFERFHDITPQ